MSLFDWRVAKRQIQSGYNFGYDAAIEHYANLKRKMFDQIAVNQSLINGNYYEEVEKLLQQELSELYDGTSKSLSSLSYKSLSTIQQMVKDVFDGTDSGILTSFASELNNLDIRVNLDDSEEKLSYRMRQSQIKKIPLTLILGDKERDNNTISYRKFGSQETTTVSKDEFIKMVKEDISNKVIYQNN